VKEKREQIMLIEKGKERGTEIESEGKREKKKKKKGKRRRKMMKAEEE
jgi:hypothetical protein